MKVMTREEMYFSFVEKSESGKVWITKEPRESILEQIKIYATIQNISLEDLNLMIFELSEEKDTMTASGILAISELEDWATSYYIDNSIEYLDRNLIQTIQEAKRFTYILEESLEDFAKRLSDKEMEEVIDER